MTTTTRPPTRVELVQLATACSVAEQQHTDALLRSGGTTTLDPPVIAVPVDVFGVDELPVAKVREHLLTWRNEPPPAPPAFVGLKPRRTKPGG